MWIISFSSSGAIFLLASSITHAASMERRASSISTNLPSEWSYKGCWTDIPWDRQLGGSSYADDTTMTQESCIAFCDSKGFTAAGVEFARECFCGYRLGLSSTQQPETGCNKPCTGDSTEVCGAGDRLNVFTKASGGPIVNPGRNGATLMGCLQEIYGARLLTIRQNVASGDAGMTVDQCTSACAADGFQYSGVEYGRECWCDSRLQNPNARTYDPANCLMTCSGNSSEYCGGPGYLTVYENNNWVRKPTDPWPAYWKPRGCWKDEVNNRMLPRRMDVPGGDSAMSIGKCLTACASAGFTVAGLEHSSECFCGNSTQKSGPGYAFRCNMPCRGNSQETCGGSDHLSLYSAGEDPNKVRTVITNECTDGAIYDSGTYYYQQFCNALYEYPDFLRQAGSIADCVKTCDGIPKCRAFDWSDYGGGWCTFYDGSATKIWSYRTTMVRLDRPK